MARLGGAWQGVARRGEARPGMARSGKGVSDFGPAPHPPPPPNLRSPRPKTTSTPPLSQPRNSGGAPAQKASHMTTTNNTAPWITLLDHLNTPLAPEDRSDLLWESDIDLARRGLSTGEQSIVGTAKALRAINDTAPWVDATWQHRIADALRLVADSIDAGIDW